MNFCSLSFSAPVALALWDGKVSIVFRISADALGHLELFIYCIMNTAYIHFLDTNKEVCILLNWFSQLLA